MLIAMTSLTALADVPRPKPKPTETPKQANVIDGRLNIYIKKDATEARLVISQDLIKPLRAQLDEMDNDNDAAGSLTKGDSGIFGRVQTIVSGAFLSLAIVFGGVWFFRSKRAADTRVKTVVMMIAVAGVASTATYVFANAGPPTTIRSITGKIFSEPVRNYGYAFGKIKIETAKDGGVTLIVPDVQDAPKSEE